MLSGSAVPKLLETKLSRRLPNVYELRSIYHDLESTGLSVIVPRDGSAQS